MMISENDLLTAYTTDITNARITTITDNNNNNKTKQEELKPLQVLKGINKTGFILRMSCPIITLPSIRSVLLLILVLMLSSMHALPLIPGGSGNSGNHTFEYKRYCSNTLSDAIRLICGGRYNSLARQYRKSVLTVHLSKKN